MKQIATVRVTQAAAKYGENVPLAVCCNACRTCVTANLIGLATGLVGGAGLAVARFGKRFAHR